MSDEQPMGWQLSILVAKALGYEIKQHAEYPGFESIAWYLFRGKDKPHWVAYTDKTELWAWSRCLEEGWIYDYAEDVEAALSLVAGLESFQMFVEEPDKQWGVIIGNQYDDNATTYSYYDKEPAFAICKAWLDWKTSVNK